MKFHALDAAGNNRREARYLSVGGGFVVTAGAANTQVIAAHDQLPFSFRTGREMVDMCRAGGHTVARIMLQNELTWRSRAQVDAALDRIWQVMQDCVDRKSTRLNSSTNEHLVCRLLLETKKYTPQT